VTSTAAPAAPVTAWSDDLDGILTGDLTAALTVTTPDGGAVAVPVTPLGLRDRAAGWTAFTTLPGSAGTLERIGSDPRVALAYFSRAHGAATADHYVLVQGRAGFAPRLPGSRGAAQVRVAAHRITAWPDLHACAIPVTTGPPAAAPASQTPPAGSAGSTIDGYDAVRRFRGHPHRLLSYVGGDGFPVTVPVRILGAGHDGIRITAPAGLLPHGSRRAGLLALSYGPRLSGMSTRRHTGWLTKHRDGTATYLPYTTSGFSMPRNRVLQTVVTGFMTRRDARTAMAGLARAA
jgi:hypothetical protein